MKTTFPEFGNFLKIFLLIAFLNISTNNLNAQSSFDMRIDNAIGSTSAFSWADNIVPCVDGGYFLTGLYFAGYYIIKTDDAGTIEWSKSLPMNNPVDLFPSEIIATHDSGFYFMSNLVDGMFGTYIYPTIFKSDKFGNFQKAKYTPFNMFGTIGHNFDFGDVDSVTNELLLHGTYYIYNGSNGACCYEHFAFKLDTALNIQFITRLDNSIPGKYLRNDPTIKQVRINNQLAGYLATGLVDVGTSPRNSIINFLDTSGNLVWTREYTGVSISDFVQVDSSFYFISNHPTPTATISTIVKTDLTGNIIFSKEFQGVEPIRTESIDLSSDSMLLISGQYRSLVAGPFSTLILKADLDLDSITAMEGVLPTPTHWIKSTPVENSAGTFLISRVQMYGNSRKAIHEKVEFDNPLCNYNIIPVTTIPLTLTDTIRSFTNVPYLINSYDTIQAFIPENFAFSSPCLTLDIEDLNGNPDINLLNVNPNPASDYIELSLDETENSSQVTIYNITGEAVGKFEMVGNIRIIPIADLSQGIYFVNVITEKQQFNAKFIKL
ncbi:MAG: T9SS type A sorting domain-containing protein [Bacteroidia bacterium]|nr:T9SS type A sorting domain-containing protein [Bacteroidia bacterium]